MVEPEGGGYIPVKSKCSLPFVRNIGGVFCLFFFLSPAKCHFVGDERMKHWLLLTNRSLPRSNGNENIAIGMGPHVNWPMDIACVHS